MTPAEERAFFEQMASCRDAYRRLADCIIEVYSAITYVDIGAGVGHVVERLRECDKKADGFDGSAVACEMSSGRVRRYEFGVGGYVPTYSSVAICTETAEHVSAACTQEIVWRVASSASQRIVWSAAVPGQEWPGHVNLQPASYWLDKFSALGWEVLERPTACLRALMRERHAQHEHCADNFHVLAHI